MKKTKLLIIVCLAVLNLSACETFKHNVKKQDKVEWDYEKYMVESHYHTNASHYDQAITLLKEALLKFPDGDILGLNYNIGFNYYKKKNYPEAQGYFNLVIKMYEEKIGAIDEDGEYRKYVILSTSMLNKIEADKADAKDPYHVKEDLAKRKKTRPQPNSKDKSEK